MTLTVLMAVYKNDNPHYLDRSLHSIWTEQTRKPNEIVLVQDGPLGTELLSVIETWKKRLGDQLILHQNNQNLGLAKSLNIGLQYASSELIARMDCDDISHPSRFEQQIAYMKDNPAISIVGGALQEFNEENDCLNVRHYPIDPKDIRKYIVKASPLAHSAIMMRRSLFLEGFKYDERFWSNQDVALWFDVLVAGHKIGNITDIVIYFRREDSMFKRRNSKIAITEFKIYVNGIYRLHGIFTINYLYPLSRLCFRLLPVSLIKRIYGSKLRNAVLK